MSNATPSKRNGWRRVAFIATTIVALAGAVAVLEPYAPWAPRIALSIAAENSLARLDSQLFTLIMAQEAAKVKRDMATVRRLEEQIRAKQRLIAEMERLKRKHK